MKHFRSRQHGIVLVVGMILLVLITMFVVAAYRMSTSNFAAVSNMQFRAQALAAAEIAIERVLGLSITNSTFPAESVDLNNDGTPEFSVAISRSCLKATPIAGTSSSGKGSSVTLGFTSGPKEYMALYEYTAVVSDTVTGAAATVREGFKKQITQSQCDTSCPPVSGQPCN